MEPARELIAHLQREDLDAARRMTPAQKFRAGGDLFDNACRWTLAGIRQQHPGMTHQQALDELRRRLSVARAGEERC